MEYNLEQHEARFSAFGFSSIVVDGHDIAALINAFDIAASTKDKPTALICKTLKGLLSKVKYFYFFIDEYLPPSLRLSLSPSHKERDFQILKINLTGMENLLERKLKPL